MCVLTAGLHDVIGEEPLRPELAPIVGICRVIPQEYGNLACRVIDLHASASSEEVLTRPVIARLLAEHSLQQEELVVAYRGAHRWVPTFQPVKLDYSDERPALLRTGGVYLITGGLGGVGLQLADYLVRTVKARLVLIGRSKPTEAHMRRLKTLEQAGGEVLTIQAHVADEQQMRFALAQALDRFGAVHGVIHAAAVPGGGLRDLKPQAVKPSSVQNYRRFRPRPRVEKSALGLYLLLFFLERADRRSGTSGLLRGQRHPGRDGSRVLEAWIACHLRELRSMESGRHGGAGRSPVENLADRCLRIRRHGGVGSAGRVRPNIARMDVPASHRVRSRLFFSREAERRTALSSVVGLTAKKQTRAGCFAVRTG